LSSRNRFVITITFAAFLGVLLFLFGLLLLIGGLIENSGVDWGIVVFAVAVLGVSVLCGVWVMHLEHRLRGHPAGQIGFAGAQLPPSAPASWRTPRRRRNSPVTVTIIAGLWMALTVFTIVTAFHLHAESDLSSYVQAHGLPREARVVSVQNISHHAKGRTWYTAEVTAALTAPVAGQTTTTVYVPASVPYVSGQIIGVLVDPGRPGYAEQPGRRFVGPDQWIIGAVVALFLLVFDGLIIRAAIHTIMKRHAWRAMLPGAHQTAPS
jgi:hypothetical protein